MSTKIGTPHAVLWTLGIYFATNFALLVAVQLRPHAELDPVVAAALQSAVFLTGCSLFAGRRPGRTWSDTFAVRRTSLGIAFLALVLGVVVCLPAHALADWIEHLKPMSATDKAALEVWFVPRSFAHGVALYVFVGAVGVFSEELLFRGALYTALRPVQSASSAGWLTAVLFTLIHGEPRFWPSILALAVLLGLVRAVSGSLWPPLFLHGAFNATALTMPYLPSALNDPSLPVVLGCLPVALAGLVLIVWLARMSASADRAR
ncbi:MAG TPA: type II CAAX endopeptidase family protein, partial [Polyangiaceae bacterium]|nr:type II CAAX endopeptidase family protein [Polyangiaceae bacterium]